MKSTLFKHFLKTIFSLLLLSVFSFSFSQNDERDKIKIQSSPAGGNVHILYCVDGFGGGNVAASIGEEGILLVDDMYAWMVPKLETHLKSISDKPLRIILNTHFHRDHIEGNTLLKKSAIVIAHKNVDKQLLKNSKEPKLYDEIKPTVTFTDSLLIHFNGEDIQIIHFSNSHTDGDAVIYFTKSKVLHMGDMFFFEMFPAVYAQGGGNIKQLIVSIEKILQVIPADARVIPGHGALASKSDLQAYLLMLKTSTDIVEEGIRQGKPLEQMIKEKILAKYDALGEGGAQTTEQYLTMLYKLLSPDRK